MKIVNPLPTAIKYTNTTHMPHVASKNPGFYSCEKITDVGCILGSWKDSDHVLKIECCPPPTNAPMEMYYHVS